MEFSQRLRSLRMTKGLRQSELAKALGVGKSTISAYENDKTKPSIDVAFLIADYFEVSLDYLLCRTDYPKTLAKDNAQTLELINANEHSELSQSIMDLLAGYDIIKKI